MRARYATALLVITTMLAAPPAGAHVGHQPPVTPVPASFAAVAADLEAKMDDHLWYGAVFNIHFDSPDKTPGHDHVNGLGGGADSALWSGVYLAGESYRYAVARHAHDSVGMAAAKARIDDLVWSAHRRIWISGDWKHTPCDPNDTSNLPPAHRSCGAVDSEPGAAFRACFPAGVPAWQQDQRQTTPYSIYGPLTWTSGPGADGKDYYCEDASSRDVYAGTTFGLLAALDLVGPDDHAMRHMVADDLMLMTDYLYRHGWSVVRPHMEVSTRGSENFVFPLFVINPQPRLNMVQAARHAADVAGTTVERTKWNAVWTSELATMGPNLATEYLLAIESPHMSYYNFNLNHLTNFNVISHEHDPSVREYLKRTFAIIDATTRDDVNAHFETITYGLTGETARESLAVQHLGDWITYRANADGAPHNLVSRCGQDLVCKPEDQVDIHQGSQTVTIPGSSTKLRSETPLPVAERSQHEDFLWQRSPYALGNGGPDPSSREPGVDFLTPYWMLRYFTEVAPPHDAPLPAWVGPTAT